MEVFEIDFNQTNITENIPINIYSTIGIDTKGEIIKLINIESLHSNNLLIEVFGNVNFYKKINQENKNNSSNIFSFHCLDKTNYFIKILTYEYREININTISEEAKVNMLIFGMYQFNRKLLNFIDKKKLKNFLSF